MPTQSIAVDDDARQAGLTLCATAIHVFILTLSKCNVSRPISYNRMSKGYNCIIGLLLTYVKCAYKSLCRSIEKKGDDVVGLLGFPQGIGSGFGCRGDGFPQNDRGIDGPPSRFQPTFAEGGTSIRFPRSKCIAQPVHRYTSIMGGSSTYKRAFSRPLHNRAGQCPFFISTHRILHRIVRN